MNVIKNVIDHSFQNKIRRPPSYLSSELPKFQFVQNSRENAAKK
jgi:hypothetical protein